MTAPSLLYCTWEDNIFMSQIRQIVCVLNADFQWTLEQRDGGKYYIKYSDNGVSHSSEGIGDGIWSIFTICAALFDAPEKSVVVIDEPELSVYPALQKRLMSLLIEYSKTHCLGPSKIAA